MKWGGREKGNHWENGQKEKHSCKKGKGGAITQGGNIGERGLLGGLVWWGKIPRGEKNTRELTGGAVKGLGGENSQSKEGG